MLLQVDGLVAPWLLNVLCEVVSPHLLFRFFSVISVRSLPPYRNLGALVLGGSRQLAESGEETVYCMGPLVAPIRHIIIYISYN